VGRKGKHRKKNEEACHSPKLGKKEAAEKIHGTRVRGRKKEATAQEEIQEKRSRRNGDLSHTDLKWNASSGGLPPCQMRGGERFCGARPGQTSEGPFRTFCRDQSRGGIGGLS